MTTKVGRKLMRGRASGVGRVSRVREEFDAIGVQELILSSLISSSQEEVSHAF